MSPPALSFGFMPPSSPTPTLPGDVINYVVQVDREIRALNQDMEDARALLKVVFPSGFLEQRISFLNEWDWFRDNYLSVGWGITLPSSAWDQVGQYESKNEAWRDKFKALGGSSIGPGPQERPAGSDVAGAVKWGAAAVIAGAAAYVAYKAGWFR